MQDRNKNRFSLPVIAAITGIILAAGGGAAWWAKSALERQAQNAQPSQSSIIQQEVPAVPKPITEEKVVEVCWLNPTNQNIELVSSTMTFQKSVKSERVLETALETLFASPPTGSNYTTAIPEGTKLLGLTIDKKGIHLNLSQEFVTGGGSASMSSRLAQVIYTATSTNTTNKSDQPNATDKQPVWLSVEGKPLTTLGQEGLIINQPMTRQDLKANFPL
jgi:spore germination protein GerM